MGQFWCENRGLGQGHILGYDDKTDFERYHFRQKSIYRRKHHSEDKIEELKIKFELDLSSSEEYELYYVLMEINYEELVKLKKEFKRKRNINMYFIIRKI